MADSPRLETDSLGPVTVEARHYWGAQTQRAIHSFAIGPDRMPMAIIHALARIKKAAALSNTRLGVLDEQRCGWIVTACEEVLAGRFDDHFPLSVWQSGSGTQTNMNVNEVIANRASELGGGQRGQKRPVHPNDHVNRSQSTNDVFPAAVHLATGDSVQQQLLPSLTELITALADKAAQWTDVVKIGRTHLQDAVPLTVAQEVGGWAAQLQDTERRLQESLAGLHALPLGGTAVGTGLGAPTGFGELVCEHLRQWSSGHNWHVAPNRFAVMGSHDALVDLMHRVSQLAMGLHKIVNDVRLLASGPRAGFGELRLPANEPGSSIMPGKVNPTQCEAVAMATVQVLGQSTAVTMAGCGGHLQMNVYKPLLGFNLLRATALLGDCCRSLRVHLVEGLEVDGQHIGILRDRSLMLVTALAPEIGYDTAARVALHAHAHQLSLRDAALALGVITAERFDQVVNPQAMAQPGGQRASTAPPPSAPSNSLP